MKGLKHIVPIIGIMASSVSVHCQDLHFSQYYNNALYLNPANTGQIMRGDLRFTGMHRNQWRSVTTPFSSFYLSGDISEPFKKENLGLGLSLMNDVAGDSRFKTFSVQGLLASSLNIGGEGEQSIRGGLQIGFTQKRIDDSDLRFDSQYTGSLYDPSASTGEALAFNAVSHLDLAAGIQYLRIQSDRKYLSAGISLFNINGPDVAFQENATENLDTRFTFHSELSQPITDDWDVLPSVQFMSQGTYREVLLGSRFRYTLRDDVMAFRRVYAGVFSRLKDAAYVQVGMDYDRWTVGLSYDINLSTLDVASQSRGGLEIAAIYVIDLFREVREPHRKCPVYL